VELPEERDYLVDLLDARELDADAEDEDDLITEGVSP